MSYTIISPRNSFIQFDQAPLSPHCIWGNMNKCLPFIQDSDIAFQFVVRSGTIAEADALCALDNNLVNIGLVADCNQADFDIVFGQLPDRFRISDLDVLYNWKWGLPGAVATYEVGECFYIMVVTDGVGHCSNCFQRVLSNCFLSVLEFYNDEDSFGYRYCEGFKNRVLLPFYLRQPQFPSDLTQFRLADGTTKTLSAVVRKTYNVISDQMHEGLLQKMAIAFVHDNVSVDGLGVAQEGEFQITWQDFLSYPFGIAQFSVQVTPFAETNNNCQICEDPVQLVLADDNLGSIAEGETKTFNVFANDAICCSPFTASIVYINAAFLDSLTIDGTTGIITLVAKDPAPLGHDTNLGRYRVTCPDGGYKEANIIGDIDGSGLPCEPPGLPDVQSINPDAGTAIVNFTLSPSAPPDGYDWALFKCEDATMPVQTGNVAASPVALTGLIPGQCYRVVLASVCAQDTFYSTPVEAEFTVGTTVTNCNSFTLENGDPAGPNPFLHVTYMDCAGSLQNLTVRSPVTICALVDGSGNMIYLVVDNPGLTITPNGPC